MTAPIREEVSVMLDSAPFLQALSRLSELAHLSPHLIEHLVRRPHACSKLVNFVPIDQPSNELRFRLDPSAILDELLDLLEARNVDGSMP